MYFKMSVLDKMFRFILFTLTSHSDILLTKEDNFNILILHQQTAGLNVQC
jgi:hypothetical protein